MQASAGEGVHWSSRAAFIMAAIGSSVGLGNLWRFPYVAGENGGGAFVLFYVLCVALIGIPVLVAELFIGRRGGRSAVGSVVKIATAEGRSPLWASQSWLGMIGSFVILTFYSVIAGWVLAYVWMIGADLVAQIAAKGPAGILAPAFASLSNDEVSAKLGQLLNDPTRMILFHGLFMAMTVGIVVRGIKGGIEAAVTVLMPAFFVLLLALLGFSLFIGDPARGFDFLLGVRVADTALADGTVQRGLLHGIRDGSVISAALGQAFFSIGLGSALMSTYGAYMRADQDLPRAARLIAVADTGTGVVAGLAIFPIVFGMGLAAGGGPTLMFQTLPLAFHIMPFLGGLFGLFFFLLAFFAAITSSIALLETSTMWVDEQSKGNHRFIAASGVGLVIFVIGVGNALSQVSTTRDVFFNTWRPWGGIKLFQDQAGNPVEMLTFLSNSTDIILPLAGLITAVFAGWIVSTSTAREAIGFKSEIWFKRWRFLIRWVCPIAIFAVVFYPTIWLPYLAPLFARG